MEWIRSFWARSFKSWTVLASGLWYDILRILVWIGSVRMRFLIVGCTTTTLESFGFVSQRVTPLCLQKTDKSIDVVVELESKLSTDRCSRLLGTNYSRRRRRGLFYAGGAQSWERTRTRKVTASWSPMLCSRFTRRGWNEMDIYRHQFGSHPLVWAQLPVRKDRF